ncbi:MAG TPA: CocE/NonD family hydrolase, partial [Mycobacterium sp.]
MAFALVTCLVGVSCGRGDHNAGPGDRGPCAVVKQPDVSARMRDGTVLRADIYRPSTHDAVPVILMRTQYRK